MFEEPVGVSEARYTPEGQLAGMSTCWVTGQSASTSPVVGSAVGTGCGEAGTLVEAQYHAAPLPPYQPWRLIVMSTAPTDELTYRSSEPPRSTEGALA